LHSKIRFGNIGAGGQFTIGTILSVIVAFISNYHDPTIILSFIFAFIGGALWGGLAGWLKARFNANEVSQHSCWIILPLTACLFGLRSDDGFRTVSVIRNLR
jgi:ABC-type uncharacterized transport system permease subunit